MDNDLMARRLRPPSEPSMPSAASSLPFTPVPSALPWETEPPAAASREEIPWDTPAAEAWPPDPAADEPAAAAWPATAEPTQTFESAQQSPDATRAAFEVAPAEPTPPEPAPAPTNESLVWPPVADLSAADASAADARAAETDTAAVTNPTSAPEAPWDRPADDDFDRPMDARVDGPSWDEPSPSVDFDDSGVFDDRPPDMLEAFHSPVAVAVEERPLEERVEAVASTVVETERDADAFADPYDEAAPVVAEVAERVAVPDWPSWNGNGTAEAARDEATADLSAVAQVETEGPVQSAFIPWDETTPEDPPRFEPAPTPDAVMLEKVAGSVGPNSADDLFASPPVTEDELPEPDEVAPWDFDAADEQPALFENPVAEVATVDFEPSGEAEPNAQAEPTFDAAPAEGAQDEEAESFEAWLALAVAGMTDEGSDAEVEPEMSTDAAAEPEPELAAEPEAVQLEIPAPSAFPATIYASGPESGLPANVVLRIELSIVDDAKRLNVTNVASASEFAPRVDEIVSAPSAEPAEPAQPAQPAEQAVTAQVDDSAWPAIWDPDRPTTGLAAPAAFATDPADAWAWTDPTPAQSPYELSTATDSWPEVDRPQDAFAESQDVTPAMAFAPLAVTDESAAESATQAASPGISTIAEPQSDLWFPSAEPETSADEMQAESAVDKPGMSLLTVGLTIGMAILVIVLVLVFIQLMTSLLG